MNNFQITNRNSKKENVQFEKLKKVNERVISKLSHLIKGTVLLFGMFLRLFWL